MPDDSRVDEGYVGERELLIAGMLGIIVSGMCVKQPGSTWMTRGQYNKLLELLTEISERSMEMCQRREEAEAEMRYKSHLEQKMREHGN